MPEMPNAKAPSGPLGLNGTRSVTKYRPGGVGDQGAPVAARVRRTRRPSFRTVIRCRDRSAWTTYGVCVRLRPFSEIHPVFGLEVYGMGTRPKRRLGLSCKTQATMGIR